MYYAIAYLTTVDHLVTALLGGVAVAFLCKGLWARPKKMKYLAVSALVFCLLIAFYFAAEAALYPRLFWPKKGSLIGPRAITLLLAALTVVAVMQGRRRGRKLLYVVAAVPSFLIAVILAVNITAANKDRKTHALVNSWKVIEQSAFYNRYFSEKDGKGFRAPLCEEARADLKIAKPYFIIKVPGPDAEKLPPGESTVHIMKSYVDEAITEEDMNAMKTAVVARAYIKESADYMMTNSEMTMTGRRTFHRMQAEIFYIDIPSMRCLGKDILVDDPFGEKRPGETRAAYGDIGAAIGRRK